MTGAFDDDQKRLLAGRARTLLERLADLDALEADGRDESAVEEVFDAWRDAFPSDAAFDRRLDREGVSREECRRAISAERLADDEPLPDWVERLDDLAASIRASGPDDYADGVGADGAGDARRGERWFPELSAAVAADARDRLSREAVGDVLSDAAVGSMTEWLRIRFQQRFTRVLYVELKTFVASHDRELAFADPDDFEELPTEHYERFVEYLFDGGFSDLCLGYPVFARLLVTQLRQWDEHLREFAARLRSDSERLADRFDADGPLGVVTGLEPLADDTHGDGRAVMRVEFDAGLTVAYKPRSVEAGATFYRVLGRLDDRLPLPAFRTPTYLVRDGYGWMEWIEHEECPDEAAVARYYRRAGALTCVAYFLEFSDCQFENLLVAGEHPMLVDAETVLHPRVATARQPTRTGVGALKDDSVLLTALLPFRVDDAYADTDENVMTAISGFGVSSDEIEVGGVTTPRIRAANTDVMSVDHGPARFDRIGNVPRVEGDDRPPEEFLDEIVEGFETTYETVVRLRDEDRLADEVGLPTAFESVENRVVYRPTMQYERAIRSLCSRECLRDGARFGAELEQLAVPFCDGRVAEPRPWSLYDAERLAVRRLDPPRFTCRTDGTTIRMNGTPLDAEADVPGAVRCRRRVESADRADMREQVQLLRGCFGGDPTPPVDAADRSSGGGSVTDDRSSDCDPITDDRLRREAAALFDRVRSTAVETDDGTYHWASVVPWNETDRLTVRPADESLYVGRCGIAVFGAGLYRVTGDDRYRAFALDAVEPVREAIRAGRELPALRNLGGTIGNGSVAYGLGVVGDLLDDRDVLADAARTVECLPAEAIETDAIYDASAGAAGTILGLLAVHDRNETPELVSTAEACGRHLLENRVETDGGHRTWNTINDEGPPPTGFAHGASGIAYALVRLWDATGEAAYRDAALEALEYESETFSESAGNWRDRRGLTEEFFDQWCYGRTGIGLARLGTSEYLTDDRVERGLERALRNADANDLSPFDHLCCGNAGRAEFLLAADERRGRRSGDARELLGDALARKDASGFYRSLTQTDEIPDPTLFHGLSGIGYAMLRATAPESLPCLVLWE